MSKVGAPRGVLTAAMGSERIKHDRVAPSSVLAPFVAHYWAVAWDLRGAPSVLVETLGHPCVYLVFERGGGEVSGLSRHMFRRHLSGQDRVFGVKFRPAAFQPFLGAPLARITERILGLGEVFDPPGDELTRAILEEPDVARCVAATEAFLRPRIPPLPPAIAAMRDLVERLASDPTITRVDQVAELAGLDVRTLQRRFRGAVGLGPKWVIQRYRLHEVAARLASASPPDLAALAHELGYADQAHFIRDFKAIVGRPPGAYLRRGPVGR